MFDIYYYCFYKSVACNSPFSDGGSGLLYLKPGALIVTHISISFLHVYLYLFISLDMCATNTSRCREIPVIKLPQHLQMKEDKPHKSNFVTLFLIFTVDALIVSFKKQTLMIEI